MERSRHTSVDSGVPLSVLERVDQAGDRFEDAWQAGRRPAIETYLADAPDPDRPLLLRELLGLDLRYRCRAGETPNPTEYLDRFPEHAAIIHEAFSATPVAALRADGPGRRAGPRRPNGAAPTGRRPPAVGRPPTRPPRPR